MGSARFLLVSSALGVCAVVALFALAADQYAQITAGDELASASAVSSLKAMLQKQAAMDAQEASLFAQLTTKKKAAVHKEAAAKKAKHSVKAARWVLRWRHSRPAALYRRRRGNRLVNLGRPGACSVAAGLRLTCSLAVCEPQQGQQR